MDHCHWFGIFAVGVAIKAVRAETSFESNDTEHFWEKGGNGYWNSGLWVTVGLSSISETSLATLAFLSPYVFGLTFEFSEFYRCRLSWSALRFHCQSQQPA
eukprot:6116732-Amphidinium_carterae.1